MIETKEKEINGTRYLVTQLGAKKGRALLARLVQLFGPALGEVVKGVELAGDAGPSLDNEHIGNAIGLFATKLTEAEFESLYAILAPTTVIVTSDGTYDLAGVAELHFAGKYGEMLQWLLFAIAVNFGDFFDASEVTASVRRAFEAKKNGQSRSPASSIGSTTE